MNTPFYQSLSELIGALDAATPESYFELLRRTAIRPEELEKYAYWSDEQYGRICLSRSEDYELVLTCWESGQASSVHDYQASLAWIHPLRGQLREERFVKGDAGLVIVAKTHLCDEDFSFMDEAIGIHRYTNVSTERAMSLHLFAPAVNSWNVYDTDTGDSEERVPRFDRNYADEFSQEG